MGLRWEKELPTLRSFPRGEVKCFSCDHKGYIALRCSAKALFCRAPQKKGISMHGRELGGYISLDVCQAEVVESTPMSDGLLDTGCYKTSG